MTRIGMFFRRFMIAVAVAGVTLAATFSAMADKIYFKDGRVLEGTITREGDGFVYLKVKIGAIEQETLHLMDSIERIERETSTPTPAAKPDEKKPAQASSDKPTSGATRVAILNFGAPSSWQGEIGSTVGLEISAKSFHDVVPMLKKAGTQVVVVRINSGGGLLLELEKFHQVFERDFKPNFRTVGWVESAISAAAMSPWVLEEFYFLPNGNMGACTGWSGALNSMEGVSLEMVLAMMEKASALGKRSPYIMRSMQIQEPLSVTIDETTGQVTWYQDETSGEYIVNPGKAEGRVGQILTLNAQDAVKYRFAQGIAATPDELVRAMGLQEVEWVAQDATDYIDKFMRDADYSEKNFNNAFQKYAMAVQLAQGLQDDKERGAQISIARRWLNEMRRLNNINPNFKLMRGVDDAWFQAQEELLKRLAQRR